VDKGPGIGVRYDYWNYRKSEKCKR